MAAPRRTRPDAAPHPLLQRDSARARLKLGAVEAEADVSVSPATILAIGALVSGILLSVVPIIRAARRPARPDAPPALPRANEAPRLPGPTSTEHS